MRGRYSAARRIATLGACAAFWAAADHPASALEGSDGVDDPIFQRAGNGGYDVVKYDLDLDYDPRSGYLDARARITATATEPLSRFNLDFRGPNISSLRIDGKGVSFDREGGELIVTPQGEISDGSQFRVAASYAGVPDHAGSSFSSTIGWVKVNDGAWVANEPRGAPTWFPSNDHPSDKAKYRVKISVPRGFSAIGNGELVDRRRGKKRAVFDWRATEPMATYLATITSGRFDIERSKVEGIRYLAAFDSGGKVGSASRFEKRNSRIMRVLVDSFGPYPFSLTGGIVDDPDRPTIFYHLETQTRPLYHGKPSDSSIAHELAHQWFGNSVTPGTWQEIWLSEGFARWSEWLWESERNSKPITLQKHFKKVYRRPASDNRFWNLAPAVPTDQSELFDPPIYDRGAMTLQALNKKVGRETFFEILQAWASQNQYGIASTTDFIELAEATAGEDLGSFFDVWLYQQGKPKAW